MDLVGSGWIWQDLVGSGRIWQDLAGTGRIWQDLVGSGMICLYLVGSYLIWLDLVGSGKIWQDLVGSGKICLYLVGSGRISLDLVGSHWIWLDLVGSGRTGRIWQDLVVRFQEIFIYHGTAWLEQELWFPLIRDLQKIYKGSVRGVWVKKRGGRIRHFLRIGVCRSVLKYDFYLSSCQFQYFDEFMFQQNLQGSVSKIERERGGAVKPILSSLSSRYLDIQLIFSSDLNILNTII